MFKILIRFVFISLTLSSAMSLAKPFRRALVLSGGGADWAMFAGIYQEMRSRNLDSDLIVGVCGGSFAAAMAYAKPDADFSNPETVQEFFDFTQNVKMEDRFITSYIDYAIGYPKWIKKDEIPPFTNPTVLKLPDLNSIPSYNQKFGVNKGKRLIILGTRMLFDPYKLEDDYKKEFADALANQTKSPGRPKRLGRKLFRLTIFTDPETAKVLRKLNLNSKPAIKFPDSAMETQVDIVDTATIGEAVRASIADPLLLIPAKIGDNYYVTGATDNYPTEIVSQFADEIIHTYTGPLPQWQNDIFKSAFKYDANEVIGLTNRKLVSRWVYLGSRESLGKISMNPGIHKTYTMVVAKFPKTKEKFNEVYKQFYDFGRQRAVESFKYKDYEIDPVEVYLKREPSSATEAKAKAKKRGS